MRHELRIAVLVRTDLAYGRGVTRGIARYARQQKHWRLHAMIGHDTMPPPGWVADAGIGHLPPDDWNGLLAPDAPRVLIGYLAPEGAARVFADEKAIGRLGAEHLLGLGLKHLTFVGGLERGEGFREAVRSAGAHMVETPEAVRSSLPEQWPALMDGFVAWLKQAPRPLGAMAMHDVQARHVSVACRLAGLRVPDEVAILGVDNDELVCELSDPPLSSVEQGLDQIGYEAAAMLARMLDGEPPRDVIVPPHSIVPRQSSDVLAVDDPDVAAAIRFIRQNAYHGITMDQVADAIPAARRTLERRFKRVMGHTLHTELVNTRVQHAKELLISTERSLEGVAEACGFNSLKHFHDVFRRLVNDTPASFRQQRRVR